MSFIDVLKEDLSEKSLLKHPFYQAWNEGKLSKEALQLYAKQYYHFTEQFPRFVANVFSNCGDVDCRRKIIHNLVEEELGDYKDVNPHAEQWIGFCEGLGLVGDVVKKSALLDTTAFFLLSMQHITRRGFLNGVAGVWGYEAQVSEIAKSKKDGLQKFYGFKNGKSVEFFDTHMVADIEHSKVWEGILADVDDPKVQQQIRGALNESLDAQWRLLDGIMAAC